MNTRLMDAVLKWSSEMNKYVLRLGANQLILRSALLLGIAMALAPVAQAAYPRNMAVTVEIWNDSGSDLRVASASWLPPRSALTRSVMAHDVRSASFSFKLNNPHTDSATFRMEAGSRQCKFTVSHEKTFSWFGLNPAPDKFVSATSSGTVPAQCSASVIKGHASLAAYTVRVSVR